MAKKSKPRFKNKSEMLAFLKEIGKRNEAAIKRLDKALEREEAFEMKEADVEYKRLKK